MNNVSSYAVEAIRNQYPKGTRVELVHMNDPYTALPRGLQGTVMCVDDMATVFVHWDNGSRLGIVYRVDSIKLVESDTADQSKP